MTVVGALIGGGIALAWLFLRPLLLKRADDRFRRRQAKGPWRSVGADSFEGETIHHGGGL